MMLPLSPSILLEAAGWIEDALVGETNLSAWQIKLMWDKLQHDSIYLTGRRSDERIPISKRLVVTE